MMTRGREGVRGEEVLGVYACEGRAGLTEVVCVGQGGDFGQGKSE